MENFDVVELCERLIAIDSINPFTTWIDADGQIRIDGNESEILDFCEQMLQRAGFETQRQACGGGRHNLLAQKGSGEHALLLYSHVDTVEVKPGWSYEEALHAQHGRLQVDGREQDVLFGLGSNDMKGGLAVLLRTACLANPQTYTLKIALGCDEEFWSLGSHCLVQDSHFLDDVIGVIVPEVGESTLEPEPGKMLVTLGRCGRAEFIIDVPGTGGHGAEPERTGRVNALTQAAHIALAIEEYSKELTPFIPFPGHPERCKPSALVTSLQGGEGLLSIPAQAQLIVNRVLAPDETLSSAQEALEKIIQHLRKKGQIRPVQQGEQQLWPTVTLRPRPTPPLQPYVCSPTEPFIQHILSTLEKHIVYQLGMGVSVADENRFAAEAHLPVVVLGPRGENSHAAQEWVTLDSLRQLEELYTAILSQMEQYTESIKGTKKR